LEGFDTVIRLIAAVGISFALLTSANAAGPVNGFTVGNWQGGAYTDDRSGEFSHCAASTLYKSGVSFFVAITKDLNWNIAFSNKDWALVPNEQMPVRLIFDNKNKFEVFALAQSPDMVVASMPTASALISLFKQSSFMDTSIKGQNIRFKMDGTNRLLATLENCVNEGKISVRSKPLSPQVPGSLASGAPSEAASAKGQRDEVEALKMLMSFLLKAEIRDAKIISGRDVPISYSSYSATWKNPDLIGGIKILPVDPNAKGIDIAAAITAEDAKACKGRFASGRVSELVDSDVVFRGFSSCDESAGSRMSQYFIIPRNGGGFVVFAVSSAAPVKEQKLNKEEALSNLRKAALTSTQD
jgi:hypothetical protein